MPRHRHHRTTILTAPNNIPILPLPLRLSAAISEFNRVAADCQNIIARIEHANPDAFQPHILQPLLESPLSEEDAQRSATWFRWEIARFTKKTVRCTEKRDSLTDEARRLGC